MPNHALQRTGMSRSRWLCFPKPLDGSSPSLSLGRCVDIDTTGERGRFQLPRSICIVLSTEWFTQLLCRRATRFCFFGRPPSLPFSRTAAVLAFDFARPPRRPRDCAAGFIVQTIQIQRRCSPRAMRCVALFLLGMDSSGLYPKRTAPPRSRAMRRGLVPFQFSYLARSLKWRYC